MQRTSISFKTFLVAVALTSPFLANADAKSDLQQTNKGLEDTVGALRTDFDNQADNNTGTAPKGRYKTNFERQLSQLEDLVKQAKDAVAAGNKGGKSSRRRTSADDLRIAPMITNAIANLSRLKKLGELDDNTRDDVKEFLEGIKAGSDDKLARQIDAALSSLDKA